MPARRTGKAAVLVSLLTLVSCEGVVPRSEILSFLESVQRPFDLGDRTWLGMPAALPAHLIVSALLAGALAWLWRPKAVGILILILILAKETVDVMIIALYEPVTWAYASGSVVDVLLSVAGAGFGLWAVAAARRRAEHRDLRRIVFIASGVDRAQTWEWLSEHLKGRVELCFILLNEEDSHFERVARERWSNVARVTYRGPKDLPRAFFQVWRLLLKWAPDAVHVHLKWAGLIALPAAMLAGVKERFYTRHHSTYHHEYFPKAVKQDRFINRCATKIVAISVVVREVLTDLEGVDPGRIQIIHHGFDLDRVREVSSEAIQRITEVYNPSGRSPVIGVVSRYERFKGVEYTVEAFRRLLLTHPNALLLLAGAYGPDEDAIRKVVRSLPESSYVEVEFEPDVFALYRLFDVFVHVPVDKDIEAYGMIYVEALASGVPSIVTLSGVATEFIEADRHAVVVPYRDSGAIYEGLERLLGDEDLRRSLAREGSSAVERFGLERFVEAHARLYGAYDSGG